MGFPSFDYRPDLAAELQAARDAATKARRGWAFRRPLITTQSQSAAVIFTLLDDLRAQIQTWERVAAVPGMGDFAQAALVESERDIVADFTAMVTAALAARDWIVAAFPKDGDGYLLRETFDASGARVERQFTPQQLGGLVTVMDALAATID